MTRQRTMDYDGVLTLLSTGRHVSTAEIAAFLVTSPIVVRKVVMNLRRDGYAIEGVHGVGYIHRPEDDTPGRPTNREPRAVRTANPSSFGDRLRHQREARGLSQADLARRTGTGSATICLAERGKVAPAREVVERLAVALELGVVDRDRLLVLAGYCPPSIARLGPERLDALLSLLNVEAAA